MAQDKVCNSCSGALNEDSKFCPACGTSVVTPSDVDCPSCGEKNEPKSKYCDKCGSRISLPVKPQVNRPEQPRIRQTVPNPDISDKPIEDTKKGKTNKSFWDSNYGMALGVLGAFILGGILAVILGYFSIWPFSDSTSEFINAGTAYMSKGEYQKAITNFDKAIEIDANDDNAYNYRGASYGILGDHEKALWNFNKAVEIDPENANYYANRASAHFGLFNDREALKNLDKAIQLNPNNPIFYDDRANIHRILNNFAEADWDLAKATQLRGVPAPVPVVAPAAPPPNYQESAPIKGSGGAPANAIEVKQYSGCDGLEDLIPKLKSVSGVSLSWYQVVMIGDRSTCDNLIDKLNKPENYKD